LVVDFGVTGPEKYSEFVTVISDQYKVLTHKTAPVSFSNTYDYYPGEEPNNIL
jgi:hypothetical protein